MKKLSLNFDKKRNFLKPISHAIINRKGHYMSSKLSILYVEDQASIEQFVRLVFDEYDIYNVQYASNGKEALTLYEKTPFDIVITDMMMPEMDGFTLIEEIRKINEEQIFIMVTGLEKKEDFIRAIELKINSFIAKPIEATKFISTVKDSIKLVIERQEFKLSATLLEQYRQAIDASTILSKTDLSGKITYVNDEFCRISHYTRDELLGKPHNILRHPEMSSEVFADMWQTIQSQKQWKGIVKNRAKDGSSYIVDATIIPLLDSDGNTIEYIGIRHDITELEQYKEILKEQLNDSNKSLQENINYTQQYEAAISNSTAILKTDLNNKVTYINQKFRELSGYTLNDLKGRNCSEIRHKKHIERGDCARLSERVKDKEVVCFVFENIAKNGGSFYTSTTIYPMKNSQGEVTEHLHLMHDINEIIQLHNELDETQKEIIFKMGEIAESRSKETGQHVRRVAEYTRLLALLHGINEDEADILKMASPMHDIGKVGIPDSILNKPGKLNPDEFELMKTHTTTGYQMLNSSNRPILKAASIVAGEHHEKWDGSGYPKGLQGEEIHIYGRITAIADVFDALGSDRVYKKAWGLDRILELFKEERGKHFDPSLIDLFFENLDDFLKIRDTYKDN